MHVRERTQILQKPLPLPPERTLRELSGQLAALQRFKGLNHEEARPTEKEWEISTEGLIAAGFGDPSVALKEFRSAKWAGKYNRGGIPPSQRQANFESRAWRHEALLHALIKMLRLQLPEEAIKGVYERGDDYGFYRDLSGLVESAGESIFFVDPYVDEGLFNLYVGKVPVTVALRVLSNKIGANVEAVAKKYARGRNLELRLSAEIHDRAIFLDQRGWVTGQSIKDSANNKPTYLIEIGAPLLTTSRGIHNRIWNTAKHVIEGARTATT